MATKFQELLQVVEQTEKDRSKFFEKGNASAGTRLRKALMSVKGLCHELRQDIQSIKRDNQDQKLVGGGKKRSSKKAAPKKRSSKKRSSKKAAPKKRSSKKRSSKKRSSKKRSSKKRVRKKK